MTHQYTVKPILNRDVNLFLDDRFIMHGEKIWEVEHIFPNKNRFYNYYILKQDAMTSLNKRPIGQKTKIYLSYWPKDYPVDLMWAAKSGNPLQQAT